MVEYKQIKYIKDSGFGPFEEKVLYAKRNGNYMEIFNDLGWKIVSFSLEGQFNLGEAVGKIAKNFETLEDTDGKLVELLIKK